MSKRNLDLIDQPTTKMGYDSHIRGFHKGYATHHVFPGMQMAGNEAGANASIYAYAPDAGTRIEINRRHDGGHPWHKFHKVYPVYNIRR